MRKSIAICALAAVFLDSIVPTLAASATIRGTIDIQNHNNNLCDAGQLRGGGLAGLNRYEDVYSLTSARGGAFR